MVFIDRNRHDQDLNLMLLDERWQVYEGSYDWAPPGRMVLLLQIIFNEPYNVVFPAELIEKPQCGETSFACTDNKNRLRRNQFRTQAPKTNSPNEEKRHCETHLNGIYASRQLDSRQQIEQHGQGDIGHDNRTDDTCQRGVRPSPGNRLNVVEVEHRDGKQVGRNAKKGGREQVDVGADSCPPQLHACIKGQEQNRNVSANQKRLMLPKSG